MSLYSFRTKLGAITLTESEGMITDLAFRATKNPSSISPLLRRCAREIEEYLSGTRTQFTVPVRVGGTAFDQAVLGAMQKIAFGKTVSYAHLAEQIGKPKAYRAVANACGRNRMPILIPCHRVVATDGIGGFSAGINRKKMLLGVEQ